ncbi:type II secretion system F family protein [Sulfobacillus thermosulfidooxidans]|uniref:type II secretion system F family protein n=1 Tax=Sulfobacillus thermosulfidooxidans TaxID=28034 RepID=UPI000400E2F6|nr:type II secretion system F family protein [Sulfobacillus thermosulfidooxidans]
MLIWLNITIAALLASAVVALALWVRDLRVASRQRTLNARLQSYQFVRRAPADELELPFFQRVVLPMMNKFISQLSRILTPAKVRAELARRLRQAGSKLSPELFVLYRLVVSALLLIIGIYLATLNAGEPSWQHIAIPLGMGIVGYVLMGVRLKTQAQNRLKTLERSLPEVFDLLSVSVEAGLAFDAAMRKLVSNIDNGPAKEEFSRVMSDIQLGMTRAEALTALAERTKSRELKRFAGLVAQSDRTGSGIAGALRVQARDIKEARAAQAREKAALIPIKIIFPMVLFIFPAIFVVILGPAMLSLAHLFHG